MVDSATTQPADDESAEFTFEVQDSDGTRTPIEPHSTEERDLMSAVADFFGDMGVTGIVFVDPEPEDDEPTPLSDPANVRLRTVD